MNLLIMIVVEIILGAFAFVWLKTRRKTQLGHWFIVWTEDKQQVSRISYDRSGSIYYILSGNGIPVYVGQSKNPEQRIKQHISKALEDSELYDWIKSEIDAGRSISYSVVAHGENSKDVNRLEKENIAALLDQGVALFNVVHNPLKSKTGQYIREVSNAK